MNLNVILIEDDLDLAANIIDFMELESIDCDHASNGVAGLNLIKATPYQVIILDLNLPLMDGLKVCEYLRANGCDTPILMLTARDTIEDKVSGFHAGTDDYLVKPFALAELVLRVKALSGRRSSQSSILKVSGLSLDLHKKQAYQNDVSLRLSPIGLKLLEVLMKASPQPVSRQTLISEVWGEEQPDSNSLKVHMFKLRKAIEAESASRMIHTRKGLGFALYEEG